MRSSMFNNQRIEIKSKEKFTVLDDRIKVDFVSGFSSDFDVAFEVDNERLVVGVKTALDVHSDYSFVISYKGCNPKTIIEEVLIVMYGEALADIDSSDLATQFSNKVIMRKKISASSNLEMSEKEKYINSFALHFAPNDYEGSQMAEVTDVIEQHSLDVDAVVMMNDVIVREPYMVIYYDGVNIVD